jgi:Domain of unknown function (DUF3560)
MITITHTHADGTLIEGSAKGDGVYDIVKGLRDNWRYFPSIRRIGIGQSRDRNADTWKIRRAAEALRSAGHEVTVTVDDSQRRDVATIEAERAERAEARAERYEERSERVGTQAQADYARARQMGDAIPFGQPMMPDHYSYNRDRNYRARMGRTYDRAFAGMDQAEELARRAESAEATQRHREAIPVTLRRIAKLEADERRIQRTIAGRDDYVLNEATGQYEIRLVTPGPRYLARLETSLADVREKLTYWREHVKAAEARGVKVWTAADFTKGDYVREGGRWYHIERVNPKSLSVPHGLNERDLTVVTRADVRHAMGPSQWTRKITYDDVQGRKSAGEMAEALAQAGQASA